MLVAYKYRLYPNKEQQIYFAKCFGCVRFIYNRMLSDKIEHYNMLELEIELEKQDQDTLQKIKKMLEDNEIIVTELDMSKYKNNIIKIIGKDKKKSEHSFVTDLISFDNVIKVEQN